MAPSEPHNPNIRRHPRLVTDEERRTRNGHRGAVLWLTGLSGSGKSTLAVHLERALFDENCRTCVLDGDNVRHGLCGDLGFSREDRGENIRRIGEVANLMRDAGMIAITAFISPYRADRDRVRERTPPGQFVEIYIECPLEVCERRDPKGLYKKARAGLVERFTGVSDPYEPPPHPEIVVPTDRLSIDDSVGHVLSELKKLEIIR
jgi:adenylylsulfate kinase